MCQFKLLYQRYLLIIMHVDCIIIKQVKCCDVIRFQSTTGSSTFQMFYINSRENITRAVNIFKQNTLNTQQYYSEVNYYKSELREVQFRFFEN